MECPKCHSHINENQTVCPVCHKVLLLECPNCHELGDSAICEQCGYTILIKCSKCSKINHAKDINCKKCGFPLNTSLAYQECESDEFASATITFGNLSKIRKSLKTKELFSKFYYKLKNLIVAHTKSLDGKIITYGNEYVVNFNKELSFQTSANKAVRFALKLENAFCGVNSNVLEQFGIPLNLTVTINTKKQEQLQDKISHKNTVKPLLKKSEKRYLKGLQIILDEYVRDAVNKDFKTDSLYTVEEDGKTVTFYEILLDKYVLPPSQSSEDTINISPADIKKSETKTIKKDLYSFKVFDINAKCKFENANAINIYERLNSIDMNKEGKIITLRSDPEYRVDTNELAEYFSKKDYSVISVCCNKNMNFKPWGFFEAILRDYYNLPTTGSSSISVLPQNIVNASSPLFDLLKSKPAKALTAEDARYNYIEKWGQFFGSLKNTVIIVDGFEYLDDTSIQTLELYFGKFTHIKPNFVFITDKSVSVHSKFKGLVRTPYYTEYTLNSTTTDECLSIIKSDAGDFINSFFFEKIKENFNGSYLYFKNAIDLLLENDIIVDFQDKLIVKGNKSAIIPATLDNLYKARLKNLGKNPDASLLVAYSSILGSRLDFQTIEKLGIKNTAETVKYLASHNLAKDINHNVYISNFNAIANAASSSMKKQAEEFVVKNIVAQLGKELCDSDLAIITGKLNAHKEEYLTLWKNSQFAIKVGDYDVYLKNCLKYLSTAEKLQENIEKSVLEENKKEVYNNILMFLYNYSPAKIYFIENVLLMDAIEEGDDEKIVKLSNLMLQGALISSNYTDALGLLHNILARMKNPTLIVNGEVNTKFLLLSLVNIEILYNIGDFRQCVEIANEILGVLNQETIEKAKPASFSINLFVSHIMETLRLAAFSKLYMLDDDIYEFFEKIQNALNAELPEKDCIIAIRDFLAGKTYTTENIEEYSAFSKTIFLILQEISNLNGNYKRFAQNIYQAKLLAIDTHQKETELFCDLLIAYAYFKENVKEKAEAIYNDVLKTAERDAIFNILAISKYLLAELYISDKRIKDGVRLINDTLTMIRKYDNQSQILFALFEKLYIEADQIEHITGFDPETEVLKLEPLKSPLSLILS